MGFGGGFQYEIWRHLGGAGFKGRLTFAEPLKIQDNEINVIFTGKISASGDEIKFTRKAGDFGASEATAKRKAATAPANP